MTSALIVVNEGSSCYMQVSFTDQNGDDLVPGSISYTIHDEASGAVLLDETSIIPAATVEVHVQPSINAMHDAARSTEIRVATIEASYGDDGGAVVEEVRWCVKNLRFKL